jgi:16S rRNA (adenine1518-N6/adenine1519-N6)-dimethyltransferase
MQKLGQHFLRNDGVVIKILAALDLQEDDVVLEIGPGNGELTIPLARACEEKNCRLVAIEKDEKLADALTVTLTSNVALTNVKIIKGDVLKTLSEAIAQARVDADGKVAAKRTRYKIVGNLPYYITGKLLRIISELEDKPERCVFMVQEEVAERICAEPPQMNRLAASVQFWAETKTVVLVPRKDFSPPPNVDSAVIALTTKPAEMSLGGEQYYRAVRAVFAQPRKTLLNNIVDASDKISKTEAGSLLESIGIPAGVRPQNLSIDQIAMIAGLFF